MHCGSNRQVLCLPRNSLQQIQADSRNPHSLTWTFPPVEWWDVRPKKGPTQAELEQQKFPIMSAFLAKMIQLFWFSR